MLHSDSAQLLMSREPGFEGVFRLLRLNGQEVLRVHDARHHTDLEIDFFLSPRLGQGNQEQCAKDVVEHERNLQEFAMLHGAWIGL
jgi:hypothetical protein